MTFQDFDNSNYSSIEYGETALPFLIDTTK